MAILRRLVIREGFSSLIFLTVVLLSVAWSVEGSNWVPGLSIIPTITICAIATGFVLAKARPVPRWFAHFFAVLAGVWLILTQMGLLLPADVGGWQERSALFLHHVVEWLQVVYSGRSSDDPLMFAGALSVIFWGASYAATWSVFRSHKLWWALLPPGLVFVINASYARTSLQVHFVAFALASLLLAVRMNMFTNQERWDSLGIKYPSLVIWRAVWSGLLVCSTVLFVAGFLPVTEAKAGPFEGVWTQMGRPLEAVQKEWNRAFWSFGSASGVATYSSFSSSFNLGSGVRLGDGPVLSVKSDSPAYMQGMTYDTYTGRGWSNTSKDTFQPPDASKGLSPMLLQPANSPLLGAQYHRRVPFTQTVTILEPSHDVVLSASQIHEVDRSTLLQPAWHTLDLEIRTNLTSPDSYPLELRALLRMFRNPDGSVNENYDRQAVAAEMKSLGGKGIDVSGEFRGFVHGENQISAKGPFANYDDMTAVHFAEKLGEGSVYTATSLVSEADKSSLRLDSSIYPGWINERYLQLPAGIPPRIRDLALQVTSAKSNPYDKAEAIESYLRTFKYSQSIEGPPQGRDVVDYFLFDGREGYCEYFSSAMVVMLRSIGVPAREVTGYTGGALDPESQSYQIKESNAHAWPQVYFPSYGWVDFEPTPSQPPVWRSEGIGAEESGQDSNAPSEMMRDFSRFSNLPYDPDNQLSGNFAIDVVRSAAESSIFRVGAGFFGAMAIGMAFVLLSWRMGLGHLRSTKLAYAKLCKAGAWLGIRGRTSQTPYEFGEALGAALPGAARPVSRIVSRYVEEAYSGSRSGESHKGEPEGYWNQVRGLFVRALLLRPFRRWRRTQ